MLFAKASYLLTRSLSSVPPLVTLTLILESIGYFNAPFMAYGRARTTGMKINAILRSTSHTPSLEDPCLYFGVIWGVVHTWVRQKHLNCFIFKCVSLPVNAS